DELTVNLDVDGGIVLLALFLIFGEVELSSIFAELRGFAIVETIDGHTDPIPVIRPDHDSDDLIFANLDIMPGAQIVARFTIERITRLSLSKVCAQNHKE